MTWELKCIIVCAPATWKVGSDWSFNTDNQALALDPEGNCQNEVRLIDVRPSKMLMFEAGTDSSRTAFQSI